MNKITLVDAKFHAIDIHFDLMGAEWKDKINILWGQDVFINNIPVVKTIVLVNAIVWVVMYLLLR